MSTRPRIYLDHNASTPLAAPARAAMADAMADVGNPSSVHAEGRRARDLVERARRQVADLVGRPREQVIFTSGGTEANQLGVLALAALAEQRGMPRVIATSPLEHPSLRGAVAALAARGWQVVTATADRQRRASSPERWSTTSSGRWRRDARRRARAPARSSTSMPSRRPASSIYAACGPMRSRSAPTSSADRTASARSRSRSTRACRSSRPAIRSADGARGPRTSLGIVGFGAAAAAADLAAWPRVVALGDRLEAGIRAIPAYADPRRRPPADRRHDQRRVRRRTRPGPVIALDLAGIAASTGAACTSGSVKPSEVLLGLGLSPEQALEAVRFSLGTTTTDGDIDEVLSVLPASSRERGYIVEIQPGLAVSHPHA